MTANKPDKELLGRIERLITRFHSLVKDAEGGPRESAFVYALRGLVCLAGMVLRNEDIFALEPWHAQPSHPSALKASEMLLRLKTYQGKPMPPYPIVMTFYEQGFTAELDGILFLAALNQFLRTRQKNTDHKQVSINISARSLRDPDFVKLTLERLEKADLPQDEMGGNGIIMEIHESTPHLAVSRQILALYKNLGVAFAIDDVGLNMEDVLRLSEFEGITDYIKIDRHAVEDLSLLERVVSFLGTVMPHTVMIAEGVKSIEHALTLERKFPEIRYVQGLYLPDTHSGFALAHHNAIVREKQKRMS